ncbi:MAG: hypothetical protein ACOC2W_01895, partial [bacterium]
MKYFTSDLHLGEDRIGIDNKPNLFYRPFNSIDEQNIVILNNLQRLNNNDELYIIGDVVYDFDYLNLLDEIPTCKKYLIIGNYDKNNIGKLVPYFNVIRHNMTIKLGDKTVELNHYPI